jgi:2-dehydro-3-deoxygluconokinase
MSRVVTLGETLGLLSAPAIGPLRTMSELRLSFAGAESNVAIGLARLGHATTWAGCVGDDELGRLIVQTLRGEGVDVRARVVTDVPTALMLREQRTTTVTHVTYYRRGQAGSCLRADDADSLPLSAGDILHLTGITPALGDGPSAAAKRAIDRARAVGARVVFDVNHRAALWSDTTAAEALRALAARADVLLAGAEELALVLGEPLGSPTDEALLTGDAGGRLLRAAQQLGPSEVALKLGAAGARALDGKQEASRAAPRVVAIDPVGAGDAFAAGYLSGLLLELPLEQRLARACTLGAFAVTTAGDWEGLPRPEELDLLAHRPGTTLR